MTLILNLPPKLESALVADAPRKGMTPEELVLQYLRPRYALDADPMVTDNLKIKFEAPVSAEALP